MLSFPDFKEKQLLFIESYMMKGISFQNDNLVIKDDGKVVNRVSCHKIFCIFIIGEMTITSKLIQKFLEYGISLFLLKKNFSTYLAIGNETKGNFLLRKKQYNKEDTLYIAKHLVKLKTSNQLILLKSIREKSKDLKEDISVCEKLICSIDTVTEDASLLGIEGNMSKIFFEHYFESVGWYARKPRTKVDIVNLLMDIGYTYLFNFMDALIRLYGFDEYCGVYHKLFYQRKSLVTDLMEPFRCIIDKAILKAYNLKQIDEKDFGFSQNQYVLERKNAQKYTRIFLQAIMENKEEMFYFVRDYYKTFIKDGDTFPSFTIK